MSKLGCACGSIIRDNTDPIPYKASIFKDVFCESFSDWIVSEMQSYVLAAEQGSLRTWLLSRGYSEDYISLQLDHGNIVHDHLSSRFNGLARAAYECLECGRLHVETESDNAFVSYFPDSKKSNGVLSG